MLARLDSLDIADETIVMYSTDNGPHYNGWPDAGMTPFSSEELLGGHKIGEKHFEVHIDGHNLVPYLGGEAKESPQKFFFCIGDDGDIW